MPDPTKLKERDAAKAEAEGAANEIVTLQAKLDEAHARHLRAEQRAAEADAAAHTEENAAHAKVCDGHAKAHDARCAKESKTIRERKSGRETRGEAGCMPRDVKVVAFDGHVHEVVAAHELKLGARGLTGGKCRPGSRYKSACGPTVDSPDDELDHPRFDQTVPADCPACASAPKVRSDFLTSQEQIAHARRRLTGPH